MECKIHEILRHQYEPLIDRYKSYKSNEAQSVVSESEANEDL